MNSAQSYFLISLLLITALIAIICLLILATDQPDAMLEGQRRRILLSSSTESGTIFSRNSTNFDNSLKFEPTSEIFDWESTDLIPTENHPLDNQIPMNIPLEKLAELASSDGSKFMSLSLLIDNQDWAKHQLLLTKNDGQIEMRELASGTFDIIRVLRLPTKIYRLRPVNASSALILDASFSRLQFWDLKTSVLFMEQLLIHPAKDFIIEGNIIFTLGRFENRIDAFDLNNGLKPTHKHKPIRLDEHCQSLAKTGQQIPPSLLITCPSGLLQLQLPNGQILRNFNQIHNQQTLAFSAVQVLSGARGNVVLGASRIQREMLLLDWSGKLQAKLQAGQEEKEGLWLWTAVAMLGDRIYALEHIRNRVEIFQVPPTANGTLF